MILKDILITTGISATCGIGENMFLAKVALDCLAKKSSNGIAYLDQRLFYEKIWDLTPLNKIWGIGSRIEKRLARMNIFTLRDLAHYSLEKLEKVFVFIGRELYEHAYGIDYSTVQAVKIIKQSRSFGHVKYYLKIITIVIYIQFIDMLMS